MVPVRLRNKERMAAQGKMMLLGRMTSCGRWMEQGRMAAAYGRMRDEQWVQVIHPSALKHLKLNVLISTQKQILGVRVDADIETGHT